MNLTLEKIEKKFQKLKALDSIGLKVESGKIVAIVGVNGAGKSTLFRIISGLEKPDKGKIFFNNKAVSSTELRQICTLVFQRTAMFNRSVYDNLAFGLKIRGKKDEEIKDKITEVLRCIGLKNFEDRKAPKTSGGEQQRIALARAFLLEPKILLLDEPTANLDPNSALIIERAIQNRKNEQQIIMLATHNLSQAKRLGDEVIHIHGGQVVERAKPEKFFEYPSSEITQKFIQGELEF